MFINSSLVKYYFIEFLKLGLSPELLEKSSGISFKLLIQPDAKISVDQFDTLCDKLMELKGPPALLHITERIKPQDFGTFGDIVKNCRTLGEFCFKDATYGALVNGDAPIYFKEDKEYLYFICQIPKKPMSQHAETGILTQNLQLFRHLTEVDIVPLEAHFGFPEPKNLADYQRIFKAPLFFNQLYTFLKYDITIKDIPIKSGNPYLLKAFIKHGDQLLQEHNQNKNIIHDVTFLIEQLLPEGMATIENISSSLNLNRQTLYTKLKEKNISFSNLLQTTRKKLALAYIRQPEMTLQEISNRLGYSEVSVFYRNFKKWFGKTAKAYQKELPEAGKHNH